MLHSPTEESVNLCKPCCEFYSSIQDFHLSIIRLGYWDGFPHPRVHLSISCFINRERSFRISLYSRITFNEINYRIALIQHFN